MQRQIVLRNICTLFDCTFLVAAWIATFLDQARAFKLKRIVFVIGSDTRVL